MGALARAAWVAALLTGCIQAKGVDTSVQPTLTDPKILSFSVQCDVDKGNWTLTAEASSWTAGATSVWTADSAYTEVHFVPSVWFARDGSHDSLSVTLSISEDWRDTKPGTSTAFLCGQNPSGNLWLLNADQEQVDCRQWGDPEVLAATPDLASCDRATE